VAGCRFRPDNVLWRYGSERICYRSRENGFDKGNVHKGLEGRDKGAFEKISSFSEIIQQGIRQRAEELDKAIRASIEGSTITFFDVQIQKREEGHPDYGVRTVYVVRIATDGENIAEPMLFGDRVVYITNRMKWKIYPLPWTEEDDLDVFNYDWHKNKRWLENSQSSEQTMNKEVNQDES